MTYHYDALAPKFTGKERDTESGLDDFGARYFGSSMGRFMSVDPIWVKADRMVGRNVFGHHDVTHQGEPVLFAHLGECLDEEIARAGGTKKRKTPGDLGTDGTFSDIFAGDHVWPRS